MLDLLIYKPNLYLAENELAYFLTKLSKTRCESVPWEVNGLLHKQPEAVINTCTKSVSIITGPPGTGKTTTLKKVVDSYIKAGLRGFIICPTGKAAKRADEVVNTGRSFAERIKCSTIHSALDYDPMTHSFNFNRTNRFRIDFVIMDEFSMGDCEIMRDAVEAIRPGKTRLVFCGDQYQLPSVGPGNVARDLINCGVIPSVELDVVLRTGPNSGITYNANRILRGQDISKTDPHSGEDFTDFFFVARKNDLDSCNSIVQWTVDSIPKKRNLNPLTDIQLMCPGKNGVCGTKNMNRILREELNKGNSLSQLGGFRIGDKVINNVNDKRLSLVNGDVGFVVDIVKGQSGSHLVLNFGPNTGPLNDGVVEFKGEKIECLNLAYALTIHKAQGSEFPVAIIPVHRSHTILLSKPLVYTGITRARQLGIYVGEVECLRAAIRNVSAAARRTQLSAKLKEMLAA